MTTKPILSGYVVTFLDGLGHEKEMIFLKDRKFNADDTAARLHGTCHPVFRFVKVSEPQAQTIVGD